MKLKPVIDFLACDSLIYNHRMSAVVEEISSSHDTLMLHLAFILQLFKAIEDLCMLLYEAV